MKHYVPTAPVMELVDKDGIADSHLSELLGWDRSAISHLRKARQLRFDTAERILIAVGCEHLWHVDPVLSGYYAPPAPKPPVKTGPRPRKIERTHEENLALARTRYRARKAAA